MEHLIPGSWSEQRRNGRECGGPRALFECRRRLQVRADLLRGSEELLVELCCKISGLEADVDLEEPLQAPRLQVAGADQHALAVGDERLRMQHLRIAQDPHACL